MSELLDHLGIYAAIDRAVEADPARARTVAVALPFYRLPNPHWVDAFERWNAEEVEKRTGRPAAALPSLDEALDELAETTPETPLRARRLLAVAAAARAFPELEPRRLVSAALGPTQVRALMAPDESAERLVGRMRAEPIVPLAPGLDGRAAWFMSLAREVPDADELGPVPCSGRLVWAPVQGRPQPVTMMTTVFETAIPFDQAKRFATEPKEWECFPCWCNMEKLESNNGRRKYRETVSFKCPDPQVLKLVVDLDFVITDQSPQSASAEYRLSHVQQETRVLVNEGSLEVLQLGPEEDSRVRVKTTKKISFSHDIGGPGMANILCLLGYLGMVEDLLWCASGHTGTFPGLQPASSTPGPRLGRLASASVGTHTGTGGVDPDYRGLAKATIERLGAATEKCIDEYAEVLKASYTKMDKGEYKADDWVADMAKAWVRMLGDASTIADLGLRSPRSPQSGRPRSGASMEL